MIQLNSLTKINSENILKKKIQHFFQLRKVTADPPLRKPWYPPTDYSWCNSDCVWEAENICLLAQGGYFKAVTAILSVTLISKKRLFTSEIGAFPRTLITHVHQVSCQKPVTKHKSSVLTYRLLLRKLSFLNTLSTRVTNCRMHWLCWLSHQTKVICTSYLQRSACRLVALALWQLLHTLHNFKKGVFYLKIWVWNHLYKP